MKKLFFKPKTPSFSFVHHHPPSMPGTPRRSNLPDPRNVEEERCIAEAEALILKWDSETSAYAKVTSLFFEDKTEAKHYTNSVILLQKAMHSLLSNNPSSEKLILAQRLMQMAMKRLRKEFYQILSMNRAYLDPESVSVRSSRTSIHSSTSDYDEEEDEIRAAGDSISEVELVSSVAMDDLRTIADCMISCGYARECVTVYNSIRKSIVDEGIYRLSVEKLSHARLNKMDWEVLDLKIKSWLEAMRISVRTLFNGERILCDHVFSSSDSIRESCFAEISRDGATLIFGFPELVAKAKKSPPEKLFSVLDMYAVTTALWPEIESIFSSDATSAVRSLVLTSLQRLAECVQIMLAEFETTIQKEASRLPMNGGGVHALTIQTMNYLSTLGDYGGVLPDIFSRADLPPSSAGLPESYLYSPESDDSTAPALTARVAWLILVLLCKLDSKTKQLKDISLAYLFLANNLRHVVTRVRTSNLQYVLGDDWVARHEDKVKRFVANYEKMAWREVFASLPENPTAAEARAVFENFNHRFEEAYRKQNSFVVADRELRDEIKGSIARKIVPRYREWYNAVVGTVGSVREMAEMDFVTFTPLDVDNYLANLFFFRKSNSGVSSPASSVTSSSHQRRILVHNF
ncbi:exocyst complex component EXO70H1 [Lotus japonicus]|uniref:exocyst complex component EXO70H1 n=1 Tax=Lotus japonicus TaxID=34305 RepID=UPI00258BE25C|nr:exocyst complex component EXO70H1 [Lotus japonicus]